MNPLSTVLLFAAVCLASASASVYGVGWGVVNPAAHVPSGSVSVGVNGAVVAGPAGSVRTDNGLAGHGAAAQLSGPAGDVRTRGGAVALNGPGVVGAHGVIGGAGIGLGGVGLGGVIGAGGLGIGLGHGVGLGLGHGW